MSPTAHGVLELVKLSIDGEPGQLRDFIVQQPTLRLDTILRILLTYLPETLEPHKYYDLLVYLSKETADRHTSTGYSTRSSFFNDELSNAEARDRVRHLRLLPLVQRDEALQDTGILTADLFTQFIIHRAHRIESETGSLPLVAQLVEPFLGHSHYIRVWSISILLPLLRLDYEYYISEGPTYSLAAFESLSGNLVVPGLLAKATRNKDGDSEGGIGRDIRGLVGPWAYGQKAHKRRKLEGSKERRTSVTGSMLIEEKSMVSHENNMESWVYVNDWLLELSLRDYPQAVEAVMQWDGPGDVDYGNWDAEAVKAKDKTTEVNDRYAQTGLAMIYAHNAASLGVIEDSHRVLDKVVSLMNMARLPALGVPEATLAQGISNDYIQNLSPKQLLHDELLKPHNPFTTPSNGSILLTHLLLSSNHILSNFGQSHSSRNLIDLAIFGSEIDQMGELRRVLHSLLARSRDWESTRHKLLWLRDWSYYPDTRILGTSRAHCGIFSNIEAAAVDHEVLKAMLASTDYDSAAEIYCKQDSPPISLPMVEKTVIDAALASYDSASNGNRNRGGVRKAAEILNSFRSYFPKSGAFQRINALLKATHAMSFYSLTLQHGVPFQPVNIRAHRDPMLLVGKILEQNPRSYTKLDDLLDIGQDLVAAGLSAVSNESENIKSDTEAPEPTLLAKRRVTGMAIESALREDDFDTAYAYTINRLPQIAKPHSNDDSEREDDISWRAAYKAGCYKPTKSSTTSNFRRLEQRMELLSQALLIAPPSALTEILEVWRHCEDDLNTALIQEAEAEENWNDRGDRKIPGGFTADLPPQPQKSREPSRAAMNEEAPMGLFDVARGAAATLSKGAFPLRSARSSAGAGPLQTVRERSLSKMSAGGSDSGSGTDAEGRVRKRDMVSNMVTGGLASGIGWVLGAPPVRESEHE